MKSNPKAADEGKPAEIPKDESQYSEDDWKNVQTDMKAMNIITSALNPSAYQQIIN